MKNRDDYYVRKVRITSLFGQEKVRNIDLREDVNCIFGANGSGKTTIINVLVSILACDAQKLSKFKFSQVEVFLSKTKQRRPLRFIEVTKTSAGEILYKLRGGESVSVLQAMGDPNTQNISKVKEYVSEHLLVTHLPLSRINESELGGTNPRESDYFWQSIVRSRDIEKDEVGLLLDPIRRMLTGLDRNFREHFSRKQRVIRDDLEALKSKVLEKFLIDDELHKSISAAVSTRQKVKADDYKSAKQKFDEIGLKLPIAKLERHFTLMANVTEDLHSKQQEYSEYSKRPEKQEEEVQRLLSEWGAAFRVFRSLQPFHSRLMSILADVEKSTEFRVNQLSTFSLFKNLINSFLTNKRFEFNDVGGFEFSCNGVQIKLEELSSGEKHLLALLGKVAIAETEGAVFIADEPELSLHLAWQRKLLPAIRSLAPSMQIIVATHAPAIIPVESHKIDLDEI